MIVGVAFSTLAWSGETSLKPKPRPGKDTIPTRSQSQDRKVPKPRHRVEEGRMARELDLRIDAEEPDSLYELAGGADMLNNMDIDVHLPDLTDLAVLNQLDKLGLDDESLQELKDLNIDEDVWNELKDLKIAMDAVKEDMHRALAGKVSDYRVEQEVQKIAEAVRREMPCVRREIEKAMRASQDSQPKQWQ